MSDAGEMMLRAAALSLVAAGWLTATWTWRARHRWGRLSGPATLAGVGPYRRMLTRPWVPRRTPPQVTAVGAMGTAWGLLTCGVLSPAGLLFLLAPARVEPGPQVLLTMCGVGVFCTALGGLGLGWTLVRTSRALLERTPELTHRATPVALWSAVHHALVLTSFALFAAHERTPGIAIAVAVPCAIGVVHAWALARTARFVDRLPRDAVEVEVPDRSR